MTTILHPPSITIPDNWDDTPIQVNTEIPPSIPEKKRVKYPEIAEHCPLLLQHMKHASKTDPLYVNNETIIANHLEAVSLWKPNKTVVISVVSKEREKIKYKRVYDAWLTKIDRVGLKENSTILEREHIQIILEKYSNKKYEHTKYVFTKTKNQFGMV
jgi:hypothetical protein